MNLLFNFSIAMFCSFTLFPIVEDTCFSQPDGDYKFNHSIYHVTQKSSYLESREDFVSHHYNTLHCVMHLLMLSKRVLDNEKKRTQHYQAFFLVMNL